MLRSSDNVNELLR